MVYVVDPDGVERAEDWETLRLRGSVRRRLCETDGPVELVDTVLYRLFSRP